MLKMMNQGERKGKVRLVENRPAATKGKRGKGRASIHRCLCCDLLGDHGGLFRKWQDEGQAGTKCVQESARNWVGDRHCEQDPESKSNVQTTQADRCDLRWRGEETQTSRLGTWFELGLQLRLSHDYQITKFFVFFPQWLCVLHGWQRWLRCVTSHACSRIHKTTLVHGDTFSRNFWTRWSQIHFRSRWNSYWILYKGYYIFASP